MKQLFVGPSRHLWIILITYGLYHVLVSFLNYYKYGEYLEIAALYKVIITVIAFALITDSKSYLFLFKAFTAIIFVSMVFGLLIYYIGEPFASIRMAVLGNENEHLIYYSKGERVVGFDNKIFTFAYPLAALPILLLTLFKITRKKYIIGLIVITMIGITINGERATVLFAFVIFFFLAKKWFPIRGVIGLVGLALGLFMVFEFLWFEIQPEHIERISTQKNEGEVYGRMARQVAGLVSISKTPLIGSEIDTYESIFENWLGYYPRATHNTYINIGIYGGVFGWFLFWIFGKNVLKLTITMKARMQGHDSIVLYQGVVGTFITVLMVGLTHNAGIFTGEKTSIILLGFIVAGASIRLPMLSSSRIRPN